MAVASSTLSFGKGSLVLSTLLAQRSCAFIWKSLGGALRAGKLTVALDLALPTLDAGSVDASYLITDSHFACCDFV